MRHLFWLILTIIFTLPAAGHTQSFLGFLYDQPTWQPGSWATYEVTSQVDERQTQSTVSVNILSAEPSADETLYWIEIVTENEAGDIDKMKVKMPKMSREEMKAISPVRELVVQRNDNQAYRLALELNVNLPNLDALQNPAAPTEEKITELGQEAVETPIGSFTCQHVQRTGQKTADNATPNGLLVSNTNFNHEAWLNDAVCTGVIKGHEISETTITFKPHDPAQSVTEKEKRTAEITYTLLDYGDSGAQSQITGDLKTMSPPPGPPGQK